MKKYRGFIIAPYYSVGSTFKVTEDGRVVPRRPTKKDIEYYEILDPMEDGRRHCAENTIPECQRTIDSLLRIIGMRSNSPKEWEKLK